MTTEKESIYEQLRANEIPGGCERHGHLYVPQDGSPEKACGYCGKQYPIAADVGKAMK